MPHGFVMEKQTVSMEAMKSTVPVMKMSLPARTDCRVFHKNIVVITLAIVQIIAMKLLIVLVMNLNMSVRLEVASTARGFVMGRKIVMMEVMKEMSVVRNSVTYELINKTKLY